MLRSLVLATFLLLTLFWASTAWAELPSSAAPTDFQTHVEAEMSITSATAVTGGNVITVTTTLDEVNSDGDCSLREAVHAAAMDSVVDACPAGNGDDTVLLPPGTYVLTSGQIILTGTITLHGSFTSTSILDARSLDRVLYIDHDATVALLHLDIQNGQHLIAEFEGSSGGGIANYGNTLISDSVIRGNQTSIKFFDESGSAGDYGGGIYNEGILTMTNSIVSDNRAGGGSCGGSHGGSVNCGSGGDGGGIYNNGILKITNSTLSDNAAGSSICKSPDHDGPINCSSGGNGGGIYNVGSLTVINSTFSGNVAGNGGCSPRPSHSEPACKPGGEGGGIYNVGIFTLNSSTITNNRPGKSITPGVKSEPLLDGTIGGIYDQGSTTVLKNSIIAGNEKKDCVGSLTSLGNNLIQDVTGCTISGSYIQWRASLEPLQDNGGTTRTHAPARNSRAIDAGDCTDSTGAPVTLDQRGAPRPQGDGCDIGAFESPFTSTFTISTTNLPMIRG